jgi:hypothetical protein
MNRPDGFVGESLVVDSRDGGDKAAHAVSVFLFFTAADDERFSRATQAACDGPWSHIGIGFTMSDGSRVYFEALLKRGFVGPRPFSGLVKWGLEKHHRFLVVELPARLIINPQAIYEDALEMTAKWSGRHGYHAWQLASMWLFQRYGLPVPGSDGRVVCSEAVSRILAAFSNVDLRDKRRASHDAVNPVSAFVRILAYLQGLENVDAPVST